MYKVWLTRLKWTLTWPHTIYHIYMYLNFSVFTSIPCELKVWITQLVHYSTFKILSKWRRKFSGLLLVRWPCSCKCWTHMMTYLLGFTQTFWFWCWHRFSCFTLLWFLKIKEYLFQVFVVVKTVSIKKQRSHTP